MFDPTEEDPAATRAVESSLWEISALRNHYCPAVSALCSALDKDLADRVRTSELDITPLLDASHASLLSDELGGRRLRRAVPVAFYETTPRGLWDDAAGAALAGWEVPAPAPAPAPAAAAAAAAGQE